MTGSQSTEESWLAKAIPFPRAVLLLALLSVLVGRGLSQGLPGTVTGLGEFIKVVEVSGALLTQFCALLLVTLCARVSILIVALQRRISLSLLSLFATAAAGVVAFFSALGASNPLGASFVTTGGLLVLAVVFGSGSFAIRWPNARAAGLILLSAGVAGLCHTGARVMALLASGSANLFWFQTARGLATLGFVAELICLVASGLWLLWPRLTWARVAGTIVLGSAPAAAIAAGQDGTWQRALGRSLQHLGVHPEPMFSDWLQRTAELSALGLVALAVVLPGRPAPLLCSAGLALLGRSSVDVPLGALFLLTAALNLQLAAQKPPGEPEPADQP